MTAINESSKKFISSRTRTQAPNINGWQLLGNFHSHPKTPARPSEEDKRLVFDTNLSYLILSLAQEPTLKSFRFDNDKNISEEKICVQ